MAATDIVIGELEGSARDPNLRAAAYRVRARALLAMGMLDAASAAADTAAEIARVVEAKSEIAEALLARADIDDALGAPETAAHSRARAHEILRELGVVDRG